MDICQGTCRRYSVREEVVAVPIARTFRATSSWLRDGTTGRAARCGAQWVRVRVEYSNVVGRLKGGVSSGGVSENRCLE